MAEIASGSIDLKSLKVAGEPNKYITYITNEGIRIHDANSSTTNFVKINSNGMQIYKGGTADSNKVAQFGSTINLYKPGTTTSLVTIDNNGASFTGTVTANAGSIGGWNISTDNTKSLYYGGSSTTPTPGSGVIILSKGLTATTSIAGSTGQQTWAITAGNQFGVTTEGKLYANNGKFNGRIEATEGYIANTITIGNGGTALSTVEVNAKQSQVYTIGVNNGTTGYHFLGTLTLSGQTAEAEIEIHTGNGQNNGAYQNLTIRVNIKRGYQPTTAATAGITVRYEGDPTVITMGESNCSIIARCTEVGVLNIYMYTPNWGYADGWYQVKGRDWTWVHRGTILTTAPSEGTEQSVTYMNPYTTATNYITAIDEGGISVHEANDESNYSLINATGMSVFQNNKPVATFGSDTLLGSDESARLELLSEGIKAYGANGSPYFTINSEGGAETITVTKKVTKSMGGGNSSNSTVFGPYDLSSEFDNYSELATNALFHIEAKIIFWSTSSLAPYYPSRENPFTFNFLNLNKGQSKEETKTVTIDNYSHMRCTVNYQPNVNNGLTITFIDFNGDDHWSWYAAALYLSLSFSKQVTLPTYAFGVNIPENINGLSVSMNEGTIAGARGLAIGTYNTVLNYPFIIGNGTSSIRSNILTVDWSGNLWTAGNISCDGNINTKDNFTKNSRTYIVTEEHTTDNASVGATSVANVSVTMTKTNYTILGTVGIGMANATTSGTGVGKCSIRNFDLSGSTVTVAVYNAGSSAAKVKVIVRGLYIAN